MTKKTFNLNILLLLIIPLSLLLTGFTGPPEDALLTHVQTLTKLIRENKSDPDKLVQEFKAYIDTGSMEFEQIGKAINEKQEAMSTSKQKTYQAELETKFAGSFEELVNELQKFNKKHPDQGAELSVSLIEFAVALDSQNDE